MINHWHARVGPGRGGRGVDVFRPPSHLERIGPDSERHSELKLMTNFKLWNGREAL